MGLVVMCGEQWICLSKSIAILAEAAFSFVSNVLIDKRCNCITEICSGRRNACSSC